MQRTVRVLGLTIGLLALFAQIAIAGGTSHAQELKADLSGVKNYTLDKSQALSGGAKTLQAAADAYYGLAKGAGFDYGALWKANQADVVKALLAAKQAWIDISPLYEQMEGIVAGVPVLQPFDPILDAGVQGEVEYDLTLPDGTKLEKPGNLFGLLETSLWGTDADYSKLKADLNGDGSLDFGEVLPDANELKGFSDGMGKYTADLLTTVQKWEPTEIDAFTALVTNVPTVSDFFESWKTSRFVMGDKATHNDFVVISRLHDINDNVGSWLVMYEGLSPAVAAIDPARDRQITKGLADLKAYVQALATSEEDGKRYTPEEADLFAGEAQANANSIVGQISQVAAQMNIKLAE